jgi:excisionase family DNA binding protein
MTDLPAVLTVEEAGKVLRISRGAAYEAARTGAIPSIRIGRTIRVPRRALLLMLGEDDPAEDPADRSPLDASGPGGQASDARRSVRGATPEDDRD